MYGGTDAHTHTQRVRAQNGFLNEIQHKGLVEPAGFRIVLSVVCYCVTECPCMRCVVVFMFSWLCPALLPEPCCC